MGQGGNLQNQSQTGQKLLNRKHTLHGFVNNSCLIDLE